MNNGVSPALKQAELLFNSLIIDNCINKKKCASSGVLLAVSGGSDSMGLLKLASIYLPDVDKIVGFVDHGLREGTYEEWILVKKLADSLGIKAVRLEISKSKINGAGQKEGLQQWARVYRYELLENLAIKYGCSVIATGHTMDDQAETVLLRILRGAGIDGISAIPQLRRVSDNLLIVRPLLDVSRNDIQSWLKSIDIKWASDPSNRNSRFTRVKIRNELLVMMKELNGGVSHHLAELAKESALLSGFFDNTLIKNRVITSLKMSGGIKIEREVWKQYSADFYSRIVRFAINHVKGDLRRLERVHIDGIVKAIVKNRGTTICEIPGNTAVYVSYGELYVFKEAPEAVCKDVAVPAKLIGQNMVWEFKELGVKASLTLKSNIHKESILSKGLVLRTPLKGDTVSDSKKGRLSRVFSDKKIPAFYRKIIPLLADQSGRVFSSPVDLLPGKDELNIIWEIDGQSFLNDLPPALQI